MPSPKASRRSASQSAVQPFSEHSESLPDLSLTLRSDASSSDQRVGKKKSSRPGAIVRARSVASLVLGKKVPVFPFAQPIVKISVTPAFDVGVRVSIPGAAPEGQGLPKVCKKDATTSELFIAQGVVSKSTSQGRVDIDGFEDPIEFSISHHSTTPSWVGQKGSWRKTVLSAERWNWRENAEKPTEGRAADLEIRCGGFCDRSAVIGLNLRMCTEAELKRCLQMQALREAMKEKDYDTLHAQVAKARMAGVELEKIVEGEEKLKELRKEGLHVHVGCGKDDLRELMQWDKMTSRVGTPDKDRRCSITDTCPCNEDSPCEVVEVKEGVVQNCLEKYGPNADRLLFEEIVQAALAVEEGSVWSAGGKFIFSAFNRNQSVNALIRMFYTYGCNRCAQMIMDLVKYSESKYAGYVTAVQVNIHPNGSSYHDQHRDIYSAKQRAGPNCTCSFKKCVGTVCYSLCSSRLCRLESMTDTMSNYEPCCNNCEGHTQERWLHSGAAMYFNQGWNTNHTHGIPKMEEEGGPRISLAFLLGADPSKYELTA